MLAVGERVEDELDGPDGDGAEVVEDRVPHRREHEGDEDEDEDDEGDVYLYLKNLTLDKYDAEINVTVTGTPAEYNTDNIEEINPFWEGVVL